MHNIVVLVQYDGTNYFGWQKQNNQITVQGELTKAFEKVIDDDFTLVGSGRTDKGVHASCQIVNIKTLKFWVPIDNLPEVLNNSLNKDIRVLKAWKVHPKFNARYYAVAREYTYTFITRWDVFRTRFGTYYPHELDLQSLKDVSQAFIGKHDFTSFSKYNKETASYVCDVKSLDWVQLDNHSYRMTIRADRFVYSMVRSLAGVIVEASRGRRDAEELSTELHLKDRTFNSQIAAPYGLVLNKVLYPEEFDFINEYVNDNCEAPVPWSRNTL
ncbi:tRNA pseudouridine(38-40) synthase TruA [Candidatus Kapabacteria bacterium]|nr:tRNA pseudouridine(38-40) synthase TruA [Candidatus Kapabacteria bacterium]